MAGTSVLKLKVDDKEYNASLKQAQQGMQHLEQALKGAGKSFTQVDKSVVDYVRSIGQMEAQSKSARGRIGEMSNAFIELSLQYKQMSEEVKNSDIGKALAESVQQLKQRTIEAKNELESLNGELNNVKMPEVKGGGLFSGMGDKMSGAIQVFAGNMMTKAAGAVAELGSEIFASVQQGIELARQGEGIRIAFERLGRGDILDGLRQATHGTVTDLELMKAAVKFNDFKLPVEELGTMLAFAQQKAKDTGQSVDYMVDSIVTGLGRKSLMILDNLGLSATEVKEKMAETGDMTKAVGEIIREQMAKAGDYMETAADRAAQANVSLQNKMEELGRKFAPLEESSNSLWTSMKIGILDVIGGPLTDLLNKLTEAGRLMNAYGQIGGGGKVGRMTANLAGANEGNRQSIYQQQQAQFWKYINPREQQIKDIRAWQSGDRNEALQKRIGAITEKYGSLDATKIQAEVDAAKKMLSDYQAAAKQILQPIEQKIEPTVEDIGSGGGGRSGGKSTTAPTFAADSIAAQAKIVSDLQKQWNEAGEEMKRGYLYQLVEAEQKLKSMKESDAFNKKGIELLYSMGNGSGASPVGIADSLMPDIKKIEEELAKNPIKLNIEIDPEKIKAIKSMTALQKTASDTAKVVGSIGQAFNAIEDPAAKVAGTVAQAIANIALGYSQAMLTPKDPISWIAFGAAGLAQMLAMMNAIHSSTGYANGGIVKGNSYSGDNIPAMIDGGAGGFAGLNAGEIVLNKAAQGNLASQLQGAGLGGMNMVGEISGEAIKIVLNRYLKRTGQGEIVTW